MKLYLGSKSLSRQFLLNEAKIPFTLLDQRANEQACDWTLPLKEVVLSIALYKMEQLVLPEGKEGDSILVLTADTLSENKDGKIEGKPIDKQDAIRKLRDARGGSRLYTAFCLDKKEYKNGTWHTLDRVHQAVYAECDFIVPDEWLDRYFNNSIGLSCSNAIAIEQYGMLFAKQVSGSYTAIIGLPLFELRIALENFGFFS